MLNKKTLKDLARSGIDKTLATQLKIQSLSAAQTKAISGQSRESYKIPYFDIAGNVLKDFFRLKFLEPPKTGFAAQIENFMKYWQPKGSAPRLYIPAMGDWQGVASDVEKDVHITEGEKKAICLCNHGLPTIGLGGVYNFQNKKKGQALIPDFNQLKLRGRKIIVVFDSDVDTNPLVNWARITLCRALIQVGAAPYTKTIPQPETK